MSELDTYRSMKGLRAQIPVKRSPAIVNATAPERQTRAIARSAQLKRWYPAGEWDDLTADWLQTPIPAYQVMHSQLSVLRGRARNEYRKNDYAKGFVGMLQTGVVGPKGFTLHTMFKNPDDQVDKVAGRAFEKHFKKWSKPRNCDVRGLQSFAAMQRTWMAQLAVDGEIFVRWFNRGPMGYQLQTLDPMLVDLQYNDINSQTGNRIRFGVELDEFGAPVAFYFNTAVEFTYQTGERVRVPASQIYHCYLVEFVDQYRGVPWIATPSYRMHMLDGFEEAALVNARAGANKLGFRKTLEPERLSGDTDEGAREQREIEASFPGLIDELGENETFETHDPTFPTGDYADYVKQCLRGIAAGLQVSYPTLAKDLEGVNYTSLRHDALNERDVYMALQNWLGEHLLERIYNDWLMVQIPRGIPIPRNGGGSRMASPGRMEKYREVEFQGRRWKWVDPQKESAGNKTELEMATTTRAQIIRDKGLDPEELFDEWEKENERFGAVNPAPSEPGAGGAAGQPDDDDRPDPQGDD